MLAVIAICASIIGAGARASAATTTFTWGSPQDLTNTTVQSDIPQIVSGDNGQRLAATWLSNSGGNPVVYASTSSDAGATWNTPTALSDDGGAAGYPQLSSSADGTKLVVVWSRSDAGDFLIESSVSSDGGATWSDWQAMSAPNGSADLPQVVSSADGDKVTAVWTRNNGSNFIVQSTSSPDGGLYWDGVKTLSSGGQDASGPQIASSADGSKLTATWYRSDGPDTIVQSKTSTDGGANWLPTVDVSSVGGNGVEPQITSSSDGEKLATAFTWTGGGNARIQVSRSLDGGASWSTPTFLTADGRDAQNPRNASSADGEKLFTVWSRYNGTNSEVQTALSLNAGTDWSGSTTLSSPGADSSLPRISAADAGDTIAVTWEALTDGKYSIHSSNSTDSGSAWSNPVQLSSSAASSDQSQIATAADGSKFAAVWKRTTDSDAIIQTANAIASTIPDSDKLTPIAANGCVTPGTAKSIPRKGTKQLMKPGCKATSGQRIGVTVKAKLRGDVRTYSLFCKRANKQPTHTKRLANGTRYCTSGALKIRTYGNPLTLNVDWKAPATATYNAYLQARSYRT